MHLTSIKLWSLMTVLALVGCKSKAIQSSSPSQGDHQMVSTASCPKQVPEPYTGALRIQSKYDQSDKSKSTLSASKDKQSVKIQRDISDYTKGLIRFSDYAVRASKASKHVVAQSCLHEWLSTWADEGALTTTDTLKTGVAVRKWTLASVAMVVIKTEALSQGKWSLNAAEKAWLSDLAALVIEDYEPRLVPGFKYFNNHDHWAAWAVFSVGMLTNNQAYKAWGNRVFDMAFKRAAVDTKKQYAYFPNEIARRQLAANYTHFSLAPLIMLAYYLPSEGFPLTEEQKKKLSWMVNFASDIVLEPKSVSHIVKIKQSPVNGYKLAWLLPYLKQHPSHKLALSLYEENNGDVDGYSQLGGKIRPLYK